MTDQNKMPDSVFITEHGTQHHSYDDMVRKWNPLPYNVKYHSDPVYQSACAERDALLALCDRMGDAMAGMQIELKDGSEEIPDDYPILNGLTMKYFRGFVSALTAYQAYKDKE